MSALPYGMRDKYWTVLRRCLKSLTQGTEGVTRWGQASFFLPLSGPLWLSYRCRVAVTAEQRRRDSSGDRCAITGKQAVRRPVGADRVFRTSCDFDPPRSANSRRIFDLARCQQANFAKSPPCIATDWYRAGLESILGVRFEGSSLRLDPCIPSSRPGFEVTLRRHSARLSVKVEIPEMGSPAGWLRQSWIGSCAFSVRSGSS